jgi:hypothetical protein
VPAASDPAILHPHGRFLLSPPAHTHGAARGGVELTDVRAACTMAGAALLGLAAGAGGPPNALPVLETMVVTLGHIGRRQRLRKAWASRCADPAFRKVGAPPPPQLTRQPPRVNRRPLLLSRCCSAGRRPQSCLGHACGHRPAEDDTPRCSGRASALAGVLSAGRRAGRWELTMGGGGGDGVVVVARRRWARSARRCPARSIGRWRRGGAARSWAP